MKKTNKAYAVFSDGMDENKELWCVFLDPDEAEAYVESQKPHYTPSLRIWVEPTELKGKYGVIRESGDPDYHYVLKLKVV